ncbi:MAG: glycosyltransferase [Candidatus Competibacteraceae bacterium]|nr:glycosyltransferase [Candidatus Competibacteraceae bacterium]
MKVPSVSVVVTCYNYGHYLAECLDSILQQSFSDFEIVIVNDGSVDNTDEVMENFRNFDNIKYIKQGNSGQAKAKNTGIQNSSGDFIAFLDADDAWEKNKLEKQMPLFSKNMIGVVYSRARYVDELGQALNNIRITEKYLIPKSGNVTNYLFLDNFVPFSSSIVRRECLERCGAFDETLRMGIDWDLWLRISTLYEFDFIDEPLLVYRVGHAGQMSKNLELRQQCSDKIMSSFIKNYKPLLSNWIIRKAYAFTFRNRGEYYRKIDKAKSCQYFLKSIYQNPIEINSYKGLLKTLLLRRKELIS